MEKTILQLSTSPVTTYPALIDFFSVFLKSNGPVWEWISDHYIQIAIADRFSDLNFYEFAVKGKAEEYADTPFTQYIKLNRDIVSSCFCSFIEFIKVILDQGYAIRVCLDKYYFPNSIFYKKEHNIHTTFIYGYDEEEKVAYIADFFNGKKYTYETVAFEVLEQGYKAMSISSDCYSYFWYHIVGIKPMDGEYSFNKELLEQSLYDYLTSKDSFRRMEYNYLYSTYDRIFGLNCYDMLAEGSSGMMKGWQIRFFQLMYDHKILMSQRLKYMMSVKKLDEEPDLLQMCNMLIHSMLFLRNKIIKSHISGKMDENEIIKKILEIKEQDSNFIKFFLKYL